MGTFGYITANSIGVWQRFGDGLVEPEWSVSGQVEKVKHYRDDDGNARTRVWVKVADGEVVSFSQSSDKPTMQG